MHRVAWVAALAALLTGMLAMPSGATMLGSEGRIAFVRHNQIYTMTRTGTHVTRLTAKGKNYRPKWSPKGKRIAYLHEDVAGHRNVYVMRADGTHKAQVTTSGRVHVTPVWSPDGSTLAFGQSGTGTDDRDFVFLVRSTAPFGKPVRLTVYEQYFGPDHPEDIDAYPGSSLAWSPSGDDLAIVNDNSEDSPDTGLHLVHGMAHATPATAADTLYPEEVINGTGGECCGYQQWTDLNYVPDGVLGYAVADLGDEFQWQSNPHRTLRYPGFASELGDRAGAPSPTGNHMVFVRVGATPNIWTSGIRGLHRTLVMKNGYQPDWQPLP
jgi:hypothetical protein